MIGLLLVLGVGLVLLTPAVAVIAVRRHWKVPTWPKVVGRFLRPVNTTLYVGSFLFILSMVILFLAHTK
jgi:hypothetical protein